MKCTPQNRCRKWRTCPTCARIRQARIANAAARLASLAPRIDWATLSPLAAGPSALLAARAEFLAAVRPAGAIWTVERSPETGRLHCNILLPSHEPRRLKLSACHIIKDIDEVRRVAAYISKPSQYPDQAEYPGRLYGTAGPLWQWLSDRASPPIVQAATLQHDINEGAGAMPVAPAAPSIETADGLVEPDYAEIARRHLPDIMGGRWRLKA
jgi:hypothetical protein